MSEYAVSSYPDFDNLKSWVDMQTDFLFNLFNFCLTLVLSEGKQIALAIAGAIWLHFGIPSWN